jgi:serine protease Do
MHALRTVVIAAATALIVSAGTSVFISRYPLVAPVVHERDEDAGVVERGTIEVVSEESAVTRAVEKAAGAVVSVIITKDLPILEQYYEEVPLDDPFGGLLDPFFSPFEFRIPRYRERGTEEREVGGGTAFFVSDDGLLVTNKHVVSDPEATYTVLLNDGRKVEAKVLTRDPSFDIALLQATLPEGEMAAFLEFGNSGSVKLGQMVIVIGNALGEFRNTVSVGVVSGLSRSITAGGGGEAELLEKVIQTDAAINRGNSGGPLLDLSGNVIGVSTAVAAGAENIGFAIPIDDVRSAVASYRENGRIVRPYLGVRYIPITPALREKNNIMVENGVLIVRGEDETELAVMPGSPADKAGLRENDIITEMNGTAITPERSLRSFIRSRKPGDKLSLKVLRQGKEIEIEVVLEELPE